MPFVPTSIRTTLPTALVGALAALALLLLGPANAGAAPGDAVVARGTLLAAHVDIERTLVDGAWTTDGGIRYYLRTADGDRRRILGVDVLPDVLPNSPVVVHGVEGADGAIEVSGPEGVRVRTDEPGSADFSKAPLRARTLLTVLVRFDAGATLPATQEQVKSTVYTGTDSVSDYFEEVSEGRSPFVGIVDASGDVTPWLTIAVPAQSRCDLDAVQTASEAAARTAGYDPSAYDDLLMMMAYDSCPFSGVGWVGWPGSLVVASAVGDYGTATHELGHNSGVWHTGLATCAPALGQPVVEDDGTCTSDEYGDPYDVMGNGGRAFNGYFKAVLGWVPPSGITHVTGSGTYTISASDLNGSTPSLVRVYRDHLGEVPRYFYLDVRTQRGRFSNWSTEQGAVSGVSVRLAVDHLDGGQHAYLIDQHPGRGGNTWDPNRNLTLAPGETYVDGASGIAIRTESVAPGGAAATVTVTVPDGWSDGTQRTTYGGGGGDGGGGTTGCDDAVGDPTDVRAKALGPTAVRIDFTGPSCGAAGFTAWSYDGRRFVERSSVASGDAGSLTVRGLRPATSYEFNVDSFRIVDGQRAHSDGVWVKVRTMADTTAPSKVARVRAKASRRSVTLTWAAARDNDRIGRYVVQVRTARGGWKAAGRTKGPATKLVVGKLRAGTTYAFRVVVVDASGRSGAASKLVKTRTRR